MADVKELAMQLGQAIVSDPRYVAYKNAEAAQDNDAELQTMIEEFNLIKMNVMNEMQKEEKDEEKVKNLQEKMRQSYSEIMENSVMAEYMRTKEDVEAFINEVYGTLNYAITGEEPHSCSGSCSTCGGCH